jgi:hypothetical protein
MPRTPPAEGYRYNNSPPASHPVRSRYQFDQSFGWLEGAGTTTSNPRGGDWVRIGAGSVVGERLFENREFTVNDQGKSRGRRRPEYGRS